MRELSQIEIEEVQGGAILAAIPYIAKGVAYGVSIGGALIAAFVAGESMRDQ